MICKHFLLFRRLSFHSIDCILWCTEVFNFDVVQFVYFYFCCLCFWCPIQEILVKSNVMKFFSMFSSSSFIVSGLRFRCLIHFKLIFVYGVLGKNTASLFYVDIWFSQHHLLKRLSFPHWISETIWPHLQVFSGFCILFHWVSVSFFMWVPHCHDYCSFAVSFEVRKYEISSFVLLFQDCFNYLGSLEITWILVWISPILQKMPLRSFWIVLNV